MPQHLILYGSKTFGSDIPSSIKIPNIQVDIGVPVDRGEEKRKAFQRWEQTNLIAPYYSTQRAGTATVRGLGLEGRVQRAACTAGAEWKIRVIAFLIMNRDHPLVTETNQHKVPSVQYCKRKKTTTLTAGKCTQNGFTGRSG